MSAHTVSVCQEFKSSFARWFWLEVSDEGAVKTPARPQSPEGLAGTGWSRSPKVTHSCGSWLKTSHPHHLDLLIGLFECTCDMVAGSSPRAREKGRSHNVFHNLSSAVIPCNPPTILLDTMVVNFLSVWLGQRVSYVVRHYSESFSNDGYGGA